MNRRKAIVITPKDRFFYASFDDECNNLNSTDRGQNWEV